MGQRCQKLANHGLIQEVSDAVYRITDSGRAYLSGEYDASENNGVSVESGEQSTEQGTDQAGQ